MGYILLIFRLEKPSRDHISNNLTLNILGYYPAARAELSISNLIGSQVVWAPQYWTGVMELYDVNDTNAFT